MTRENAKQFVKGQVKVKNISSSEKKILWSTSLPDKSKCQILHKVTRHNVKHLTMWQVKVWKRNVWSTSSSENTKCEALYRAKTNDNTNYAALRRAKKQTMKHFIERKHKMWSTSSSENTNYEALTRVKTQCLKHCSCHTALHADRGPGHLSWINWGSRQKSWQQAKHPRFFWHTQS